MSYNLKIKNIPGMVLIAAVILISIPPRIWRLETIPAVIVDEPANLRDIHKILEKGEVGFTSFRWDFSQSFVHYYPSAVIIKILGTTSKDLLALRLTSVVLSLASLIPFFFIVKRHTGKLVATSITTLFSFNYYYLQFSRVGWVDIIFTLTVGLYLFWLLPHAFEKNNLYIVGLSGLLAGLLFHGYRAGFVFIAGSILFFRKKATLLLFVYLLFFSAFSLPWAVTIANNWEKYNLRASVVSIFKTNRPYHGFEQTKDILKYQVQASLKSWVVLAPFDGGGVENPRYLPRENSPVNILIRILFVSGLILTLTRFREMFPYIFVFVAALVFGQILTVNPPNGARGLVLLPIVYLISSLSLYKFYKLIPNTRVAKILVVLVSLAFSYHDFSYYQYWMGWISI